MIVSHEHRFIFLKTRKTAGTSIELALAKIAGDDAIVTPILESDRGHVPRNRELGGIRCFNHMPASLARRGLGEEIWRGYFKFCFERNPWDKLVSMYGWRTREANEPPPFGRWLFEDPKVSSDWAIYSIDGECAVDRVGRYEALDDDLDDILEQIGVGALGRELPRAKSGFRREVRYPPDGAEHVERVFHREIERFGYECPAELLGFQ